MIQTYLFTQPSLKEKNEEILSILRQFRETYPYELTVVDISQNPYLQKTYVNQSPYLEIGPYRIAGKLQADEIEAALYETHARLDIAIEKNDTITIDQYTKRPEPSSLDQFKLWFSRHYLFLFNLLVFTFIGLPFMAPVFMKLNLQERAQMIYNLYSPLCHQLAYRSFFLFGDQIVYPREAANVEGLLSYGITTSQSEEDNHAASKFIGNDRIGYKVALCQRDVAIYLSILLFGVFFALLKRKIKPIPWYIWLLFGLIPIGLDGVSQLVSQLGLAILSWFPARESTPFLRVLTGGLFGFFTAWYGYPTVEELVQENREQYEKKTTITSMIHQVFKP